MKKLVIIFENNYFTDGMFKIVSILTSITCLVQYTVWFDILLTTQDRCFVIIMGV